MTVFRALLLAVAVAMPTVPVAATSSTETKSSVKAKPASKAKASTKSKATTKAKPATRLKPATKAKSTASAETGAKAGTAVGADQPTPAPDSTTAVPSDVPQPAGDPYTSMPLGGKPSDEKAANQNSASLNPADQKPVDQPPATPKPPAPQPATGKPATVQSEAGKPKTEKAMDGKAAGTVGATVFAEEPPKVFWSVDLPDAPQGLLDAGGGLAFVALADGTVRAYRLADGTEAWKTSLNPSSAEIVPQTGVTWMRGTVFVADTGRRLRALVAASGTPAWDSQLMAQASSEISARDDLVMVGEGNRAVAAFRALDGGLAWRAGVLGDVTAAPWIGDREVVFGTTGHKMYAASRSNGEFTRETVLGGEVVGRPGGEPSSTRKSLLALGVHDGRLYAFTGGWQRAWVANLRGVARAAPLVRPDGVLVGTDEGVLYLLDKDSGTVVWKTGVGGPVADRLVMQPAGLAVGAGGAILFVNPVTGRVRATLPTGGLVLSMAEDAGTVVATTTERRLVAAGVRVTAAKPAPPKAPVIESLVTDPPVFNVRNAPPGLLIMFSLGEPRPLTVDVADARGRRVKLLTSRDRAWAGTYRFEWLGTDEKGKPVIPGVYRVRVTAGDTEVSAGIEVAGIR